MFLSNRDIKWAIKCHQLIVDPPPRDVEDGYDETSIDLHLGPIETGAKVWDIDKFKSKTDGLGTKNTTELPMGTFDWKIVAARFLKQVPKQNDAKDLLVFRRDEEIVVRPFGFLLWTTREKVGTPAYNPKSSEIQRHPELICFVDAKSTKARTGIMVHFTAPTIHAGWSGNVTLEITNLGPFDFVLSEGDAIAQLTVARITSAPDLDLRKSSNNTQGQTDPTGHAGSKTTKKKKST